jgi:hypothetical protein
MLQASLNREEMKFSDDRFPIHTQDDRSPPLRNARDQKKLEAMIDLSFLLPKTRTKARGRE